MRSAWKRLRWYFKVPLVLGGFIAVFSLFFVVSGGNQGRNDEFKPQNEFKLEPWVELKIGGLDMSINKAVLYLFLAAALTVLTMAYIAKRMRERPNNVQTTVEMAYDLTHSNITRGYMDSRMALKWFPFIATLFFFIWFNNMIGYIPLPIGTEHKLHIGGLDVPTLAIYAATANLSIPLVLTLIVWFSYNIEGIREHGLFGYLKTWIPKGVEGPARVPIFAIEAISHFVRIISLSVRLFANILAGHLLILFMGGGLIVLLGIAAISLLTVPVATVFFIFEILLIATLQAFIFATLTSIYIGTATAAEH